MAATEEAKVAYQQTDELYLWWVSDPQNPKYIGVLRFVQRTANHPREISSFGLTATEAHRHVRLVAKTVSLWRSHFADAGVSNRDIDAFGEHLDRPFLREQREEWFAPPKGPSAKHRATRRKSDK